MLSVSQQRGRLNPAWSQRKKKSLLYDLFGFPTQSDALKKQRDRPIEPTYVPLSHADMQDTAAVLRGPRDDGSWWIVR